MYSNRIAHDIVNFIAHLTGGFDWVIEMVQKALGVDNDTLDMGTKKLPSPSAVNAKVKSHLCKITGALVSGLLLLDAGETLHIFNVRFDITRFNKIILKRAIFATLRVFAMSEPELLLPHTPSFCVYLKGDSEEEAQDNNEIISNAALILTELIPAWQTCDTNNCTELEVDLQNIMYRCPPMFASVQLNAGKHFMRQAKYPLIALNRQQVPFIMLFGSIVYAKTCKGSRFSTKALSIVR